MKGNKVNISIIVPVYKVERYINRCIDSILSQTYKEIEIILVNDGSPDNCGVICGEYAKKDNRIRVIHKENGGLSSARNTGIDLAQGDYIGFVDSDDWIEVDMYEMLYKNAISYNADISMCNYKAEKHDQDFIYKSPTIDDVIILNKEQAMQTLVDNKLFELTQFACDKLYKRSLFENIRYPEGKLYEDVATTYKLINKCEKFLYCPSIKYHYTQNPNGITLKKFDINQIDFLEAKLDLYKFFKKNYPDFLDAALCQYTSANISIIKNMFRSNYKNKKIYKECRRIVCENIYLYLKADWVKNKMKFYATLIFLVPSFLYILITFLKSIRDKKVLY